MDEAAIVQYIAGAFAGAEVEISDGSSFFFVGEERQFPFATLVTKDSYDQVSQLDRPGVFRLNIGVGKDTFLARFGAGPARSGEADVAEGGEDFTALDRLLPHPVYGSMFWVCVLNPSDATFEQAVKPLLREAYDLSAGRQAKRN